MPYDRAILFCRFALRKKEIGKSCLLQPIFQFPMTILNTNYFLFPLHCFVALFLIHHLHRLTAALLVLLRYFQTCN